jgi:hypothetical protein
MLNGAAKFFCYSVFLIVGITVLSFPVVNCFGGRPKQRFSLEDLVSKADLVFIGTVVSTRRLVQDSADKENSDFSLFESELAIRAVLKGVYDSNKVRLRHVRWDLSSSPKPENVFLTSFPEFYSKKLDLLEEGAVLEFNSHVAFLVIGSQIENDLYRPMTSEEDEMDSMYRLLGGFNFH